MVPRQLMKAADPAAVVNIAAHVLGPPVVECFECDESVPLPYIQWLTELSTHGRVVALLPYCKDCLEAREALRRFGPLWE